jgi:hypothetical protein
MQKIVLFYMLVGKRRPNLKAISGKLKRAGFERLNAGGRLIALEKDGRLIIIDHRGRIAAAALSDEPEKTRKNMSNMISKLPHSLGVKDVDVIAVQDMSDAEFERIINEFFGK